MKLRRKQKTAADIDMVAFSDIAFLLIIFFILTTTFVRNFGQQMDIPSGTTNPQQQQNLTTTINISMDQILYNGKQPAVSLDQLRDQLLLADFTTLPESQRMVLLESKPDVTCERYFQVVMAIVDAGGVLAMLEEEVKQ